MPPSPFPKTSSTSGHGEITISLLPPSTPTVSHLTYTYPLKLLLSTPHIIPPPPPPPPPPTTSSPSSSATPPSPSSPHPSQTPLLFLLSYGGGLLPPDALSLTLTLDPSTRLCITTQGHTKLFAPPPHRPRAHASQSLNASIGAHAALWLAPDPTQPFARSRYRQSQQFHVDRDASVGVLDWVCEGRTQRGESWGGVGEWVGGCEIWVSMGEEGGGRKGGGERRLLLRDNIHLSPPDAAPSLPGQGLFGTLILFGAQFAALGDFFLGEFRALPRLGAPRDWDPSTAIVANGAVAERGPATPTLEQWRAHRLAQERADDVLWTAARVRGCVVVKFSAREVEGGKRFLGDMIEREGSVGREFGPGGSMCFR